MAKPFIHARSSAKKFLDNQIMKAEIYKQKEKNSDFLKKTGESIIIKKNVWYRHSDSRHPMSYTKPSGFKNKNVYWLSLYGQYDPNHGVHISLSFWKNQRFLFMQGEHYIQKNPAPTIIALVAVIGGILGILEHYDWI